MRYNYECSEHGGFEIDAPMQQGPPIEVYCNKGCGRRARRIYNSQSAPIYNAQGFHRTDYDKFGDKREVVAAQYKRKTGQAPPPDDTRTRQLGGKVKE